MSGTPSRKQEREQAFAVLFEKSLNNCDIQEVIKNAELARDLVLEDFANEIIFGVENNSAEIDEVIENHAKGWKVNRISKTAISILRIAVYEIKFAPKSEKTFDQSAMAINEAVRLAKKFGTNEEPAFINGILGGIARDSAMAD